MEKSGLRNWTFKHFNGVIFLLIKFKAITRVNLNNQWLFDLVHY